MNRTNGKIRGFASALALGAALAAAGPFPDVALANKNGPLSGSARTGCGSGCHGEPGNPTIDVQAPTWVTDGSPTPIPIHVSVDDAVEGGGGFMLDASSGRVRVTPGSGVRNRGAHEATHDGTQPLLRSWSVEWEPDGPITGCAVELLVAAMATNFDVDSTGDSWGRRTLTIALDASGDAAAPAVPVFHAPAAGDVVYEGNRVPSASGRASFIVVYGSAEIEIATSDDLGLRDVMLYDVDALGAETPIGNAALDPKTGRWRLSWSTEGLLPGPHRIRAVATDCNGNASESSLDLLAF